MYYAMLYVMATSGFCIKRVKRSNKRNKKERRGYRHIMEMKESTYSYILLIFLI